MPAHFVTKTGAGAIVFSTLENNATSDFCKKKRSQENSKCEDFYSALIKSYDGKVGDKRNYSTCPYGLNVLGPIYWTERPRVISGFYLKDAASVDLPSEIPPSSVKSKKDIEDFVAVFDSIAGEYYHHSYEYLESAIHDVRHLNSAITSHAERLLRQHGCDMGQTWDLDILNKTEEGRRALSVYCASRDISAALSMHEIAIDPKRAKDELVPHHIHKLFHKQWQISADKLREKKLAIQLGSANQVLQLTKSFSLIPMILLNNAIKYCASGSTVKVDFVDAGEFFRVCCISSGPILRNDELGKVFDKHWRGSNRTGIAGHGVGLWLAKLIVGANLGTIEFEVKEKGRDMAGRRIGDTLVTVRLLRSSSR